MAAMVIAEGAHGVNKLHVARSPARSPADRGGGGLVVAFPGDRIDSAAVPPEVVRLQDPRLLAGLLARKFPGRSVAVVTPSRLEAGCACFDHFLEKLTLTGEPLGYHGAGFKASQQLVSLLRAAQLWPAADDADAAPPPAVAVVGFSKGGIVLNQVTAPAACFQVRSYASSTVARCAAAYSFSNAALLQLLAEVAALEESEAAGAAAPPSAPLLRALRQVHYLDAGLNCRGAYLTDPGVMRLLGGWCRRRPGALRVALHGTPRQWGERSPSSRSHTPPRTRNPQLQIKRLDG